VIGEATRRALRALHGERVRFDVPLSRHTSLRVGGPADALVTPEDRGEAAGSVALCAEHGLPLTVLGGGFNTLVLDGGLDGVVLRTARLRDLALREETGLEAEAGVSHAQVTRLCVERGLAGLEFGAGIPGSVGGWVAMNAGVPAREMKDVLLEVEVASPAGGRAWHARDALGLVYREARTLPPGAVVLAARFGLAPGNPAAVRAAVETHLARRRDTQPLDLPSCGSVFKNPPGDFAGRLIELAGLKGERAGGAQISCVHANFIVNRGGARARDVLTLIERARAEVRARTGVELEPEVRIVGRTV
jgi:UDP-N-acetylmuramate dehydrogenase